MINFAHRGASGDYPENTLLAFLEGIKAGAKGLELDVHKTKDDQLVVIHDEDVERTYKGKGLVKDFTLEELRALKVRKSLFVEVEYCYIPTLEEVLKLVKEHGVILNIEIKTDQIHYENIEVDVITLIQQYELQNQVIISSFNLESIRICKEIDESIKTGLLYYKPIENIIEVAKDLKADALHPDLRLVSEELVQQAHRNNLKVNVYTVNWPIFIRKLLLADVDGIFTDYPALVSEIMNEQ